MQHSIQGILFDKDDTLIDLAAFCRKPIYMTAAYLSQHMGKGTDEGWIERLAEASGFRGDTLLADAPIVSGTNRDLMEAWRTVLRTGGMQLSEELAQNALDYLQWACEHHGNLKARRPSRAAAKAEGAGHPPGSGHLGRLSANSAVPAGPGGSALVRRRVRRGPRAEPQARAGHCPHVLQPVRPAAGTGCDGG